MERVSVYIVTCVITFLVLKFIKDLYYITVSREHVICGKKDRWEIYIEVEVKPFFGLCKSYKITDRFKGYPGSWFDYKGSFCNEFEQMSLNRIWETRNWRNNDFTGRLESETVGSYN